MRNVDTASSEVFWKITNFPNGDYKLVNVANGTGWHLRAEDGQNLSMTNNIGEQDNQKFGFTAVGQKIDNASSSSIKVRDFSMSCLAVSKELVPIVTLRRVRNLRLIAVNQINTRLWP
jgi:uncharacterized surface anchored protein